MGEIDGVPQIEASNVPDGAFLLDVREPEEWAAGHAPGAVHVPLAQVGVEFRRVLPDDGSQIIAVCRVGGRSHAAAIALRRAGYDVANLEGGMRSWVAAGKDVVTDDGSPGTIL